MEQQQQQQHLPPQQPEPQILPHVLEKLMGNFAGQELTIVGKVNRIVTDLALDQNAPARRERAIAALECAQIAAKSVQETKEKSPTPATVLHAKLAQELLEQVEDTIARHF